MKKILITAILLLSLGKTFGQNKMLTHDDFDKWKNIKNTQLSNDGSFVAYEVVPGKGDGILYITGVNGKNIASIERGTQPQITNDSRYVIFKIKPQYEEVIKLRRAKTPDDELPKDSLGIYNIKENTLERIARVKSFAIPKENEALITYMLEAPSKERKAEPADSTKKEEKKVKIKKVSKDNGFHLVVRQLGDKKQDTLKYVKDYTLSKRGNTILYHTSGDDNIKEGIYYYTSQASANPLCRASKGKYYQLALSEDGLQAAFISDLDTTKALIRDYELRYWSAGRDSANVIASKSIGKLPNDWLVKETAKVHFSPQGMRLFFGIAPPPLVQDTSLLAEEIIEVEVWNYQDNRIYSQQKIEKKDDLSKGYTAYYDILDETVIALHDESIPEINLSDKGDGDFALGISSTDYLKYISWEGFPMRKDIYSIDMKTGEATLVMKDLRGFEGISSIGNYIYWVNVEDSTYYSYNNVTKKTTSLTGHLKVSVVDEKNDVPDYAFPYGAAGWTSGDEFFLIYDRFDIWKVNPNDPKTAVNLTNGRNDKVQFRNVDLNPDEEAIETNLLLLHTFNEKNKDEGFALIKNFGPPKKVFTESAMLNNMTKAKNSSAIIFQKENHNTFYDIQATDLKFKRITPLSDANPQQKEYAWGTVELVSWPGRDGKTKQGLLYKPPNFDPKKKYPMIVNFYEQYSDRLHRHWGVFPHRSTVNAAFYSNRGYLVFNPDVTYNTGYPGPSALKSVVNGTKYLIEKEYVDEDKIGLQGHSWGGYEIAYMITQTDMFACAEAGAVVSNMISAYGGIRWWPGLSRMFQYEHGQSRIGVSLWENPKLYIENSPIFYADKVNTPLLMMNNDADGHVPWYQGIEYYVALRRLNKPVWMLNYTTEPHWPQKWQNIRDFNIRMNQFFDHYLMDKPMPVWMKSGIPATEQGINDGLELSDQ